MAPKKYLGAREFGLPQPMPWWRCSASGLFSANGRENYLFGPVRNVFEEFPLNISFNTPGGKLSEILPLLLYRGGFSALAIPEHVTLYCRWVSSKRYCWFGYGAVGTLIVSCAHRPLLSSRLQYNSRNLGRGELPKSTRLNSLKMFKHFVHVAKAVCPPATSLLPL